MGNVLVDSVPVSEASGFAHNRDGTISHGIHLREATGLEEGGDDKDVGRRIDVVGQLFLVPQH